MFSRLKLFFIFLFLSSVTQAQTVTIYRGGSAISPIFTSIKSAVSLAVENDSLVLSADTFREKNIVIDKTLIISGSFSSGIPSLIDAGTSNDSSILLFINPDIATGIKSLRLRDIQLTNGFANNGFDAGGGAIFSGKATKIILEGSCRLFNNVASDSSSFFVGSRNGGAIFAEGDIFLKGTTIIEDNRAVNGGGIYALKLLEIGDSVIIRKNVASLMGGGLYTLAPTTISDFAKLEENTAQEGGACFASGNKIFLTHQAKVYKNAAVSVGGAFSLRNVSFEMQDSCIISHNTTDTNMAAAIYNMGTSDLICSGGQIIHNSIEPKAGEIAKGIAVFNDSAKGKSSVIQLNNLRIYNPQTSLGRQNEVYNRQAVSAFLSDSSWWGESDTSGLIYNIPTATIALRSWVICDWTFNNGIPVDTHKIMPMQAYFTLHTGKALPAKMFWMLEGSFSADSGIFIPSFVPMAPTNIIESNYSVPHLSKAVTLTAVIDADTFIVRPYVVGLNLREYLANNKLSVYPNPTHDEINIIYPHQKLGNLICQITDLMGKVVVQKELILCKNQSVIPLSLSLAPGLYLLQLVADGQIVGREKLYIN